MGSIISSKLAVGAIKTEIFRGTDWSTYKFFKGVFNIKEFEEFLEKNLDTIFTNQNPDYCPIARYLFYKYQEILDISILPDNFYYNIKEKSFLTFEKGIIYRMETPKWVKKFIDYIDKPNLFMFAYLDGRNCLSILKGITG